MISHKDFPMLKKQLMSIIADIHHDRGYLQKELAEILCITQPRVSALMHGMDSQFSTGMLFRFLSKLGYQFDFGYNYETRGVFVSTRKS